MPALRRSTDVASIRIRMIGQQEFSAALANDVQRGFRNQVFDTRERWAFDQKVVTLGPVPKFSKIFVLDENVRGVRGIRSVFQVGLASIEEQGLAVRIKEHGRERIVSVVFD